uniref:Saposin B-type domain-containing protein n=1 Tax=Panagrolaimus sp. ES5 TaxID=591445 RepID=A0AC34GSJ7_9BILA
MLIINCNLHLAALIFVNSFLFSSATFSFFLAEKEKPSKPDIPETNSITETDEYANINNNNGQQRSSNLGCFLCAQLLTVTKQRVGLSQTQLRLVLNDKCGQLPHVFRTQCFAFVAESLPQIYVSLTYDMPVRNICEMLKLCDPNNPFINERLIEETIKEHEKHVAESFTTTTTTTTTEIPYTTASTTEYPYTVTTTIAPPPLIYKFTTPSPFEERRPYPLLPPEISGHRGESGENRHIEGSQIPDFKELASKMTGNISPPIDKGTDAQKVGWSKRLTCLFCERMLNNAKTYAMNAKTEISTFANSTCSRIEIPESAEQCFQLTDRKINELAAFVDEQVVEALWCAQLHQC